MGLFSMSQTSAREGWWITRMGTESSVGNV